jgi:nucleoside-diphosphate-sugar epimerase
MSALPRSRVLIIGASGFLAGFVAERLHRAGFQLRGFDRLPPPADRPLDEYVEGDITRYADVRRAVDGQDAVIQLAALVRGRREQPLERFVDVMVKGTWFVADAAAEAGVRRLVNVSSIVAIGAPNPEDWLLSEDEPLSQGGLDLYYQLAKWLGEEIGRAYERAHRLVVVNLRPGVIAGDGVNPGPVPPSVPCRHWFNYVDPRDVAQAVESALRAPNPRQSSYFVVAHHPEAAYDVGAAVRDLGYAPEHNWLDLRAPGPNPGA